MPEYERKPCHRRREKSDKTDKMDKTARHVSTGINMTKMSRKSPRVYDRHTKTSKNHASILLLTANLVTLRRNYYTSIYLNKLWQKKHY